jgi:hypothetical protein
MTNHSSVNVGCLLVGEYTDEAEVPTDLAVHRGEVVRPQVVADYLDLWSKTDGMKEFTVLLKDGRVVAVRGHGLKYLSDGGIYGVVARTEGEEVFVALFKSETVEGIFHGEIRSDRKIA